MTDKQPTFDTYRGSDPIGEVVRCNFNRRHFTPSQRAVIAAKLVTITAPGRPSGKTDIVTRDAISQGEAADRLNVSRKRVGEAAKVLAEGSEKLLEAVVAGTVSVSDAAKVLDESVKVQNAAVKDVAAGKAPTVAAAARKRSKKPKAPPAVVYLCKRCSRVGVPTCDKCKAKVNPIIDPRVNPTKTERPAPDMIDCPHCHGKGKIQRPVQMPIPESLDTPAFRSAWECWNAQRRLMKVKPYTEIGAKQQLKKLAEMGEKRAIAAIEASIGQGYQGIFEAKQNGKSGPEPFAGIKEWLEEATNDRD